MLGEELKACVLFDDLTPNERMVFDSDCKAAQARRNNLLHTKAIDTAMSAEGASK